ncbi:hypothetical protein RF11_01473 [Thelohanellus kitauei]|uniref:Uncharacterized protein n=1 Tax=Thelohanellus kitauei TaxID=669202 RepID=A0A0C2MHW4_THEKT|nr:hypothetical protein RF11_01473 [Thelohanellus kitauei]
MNELADELQGRPPLPAGGKPTSSGRRILRVALRAIRLFRVPDASISSRQRTTEVGPAVFKRANLSNRYFAALLDYHCMRHEILRLKWRIGNSNRLFSRVHKKRWPK